MTDKERVINAFKKVKALGFVPSNRSHNTGIGKTFEDYMNVVENNVPEADLYGFELKSQRELSSSYLTLFTKKPSFPRGVNTYLRNTYGTPYEDSPQFKKLHTSIFSTYRNTYNRKYGFQLINSPEEHKLFIEISELDTGEIIERDIYYTYDDIERAINKLKNLLFVSADTKIINNIEHFYFTRADLYYRPTLGAFLRMVDIGEVMVDLRLGSYTSGKKIGKLHDHGTAFRIKPSNLLSLYEEKESVE